jgi:hypothetical protein
MDALALLVAAGVAASPLCDPRAGLPENLNKKYGEQLIGMGVDNGKVIELYANPRTGTFTIISTAPTRVTVLLSCLLASGKGWESLKPPVGDPS